MPSTAVNPRDAIKARERNTPSVPTNYDPKWTEAQSPTVPALAPVVEPPPVTDAGKAIFDLIAPNVERLIANLDSARVESAIERMAERLIPQRTELVIKQTDRPDVTIADPHESFARVLAYITHKVGRNQRRINVLLVGPAGSFKTTCGLQLAETLGLACRVISLGPQTPESKLTGYCDASGRFIPTAIIDTFRLGGVCVIDEMDAANAGILTALNAILEAPFITLANGETVTRHEDCYFIATANTWGDGATSAYVGRAKLDKATLDRFVKVAWNYNHKLEHKLFATCPTTARWVERIHTVRAAVFALGLEVVVSPRMTQTGAAFLQGGIPWAEVENTLLWDTLATDVASKLRARLAEAA